MNWSTSSTLLHGAVVRRHAHVRPRRVEHRVVIVAPPRRRLDPRSYIDVLIVLDDVVVVLVAAIDTRSANESSGRSCTLYMPQYSPLRYRCTYLPCGARAAGQVLQVGDDLVRDEPRHCRAARGSGGSRRS